MMDYIYLFLFWAGLAIMFIGVVLRKKYCLIFGGTLLVALILAVYAIGDPAKVVAP